MIPALSILVILAFLAGVVRWRQRNMHLWLPAYVRQEACRLVAPRRQSPVHVLLCIADHFEPTDDAAGDEAVAAWCRDYPAVLGQFRDSDGRPPRHTFFYPIDQYQSRHVDAIAALCAGGFGEVEVHLHHDGDSAESLERTLRRWTRQFADRHGLLGRWPDGSVAYGFVHGNWALDNSRPDGRWCGVTGELEVLRRTGCYADFTLPSAPSPTQTRIINSIYYATGCPGRCKSHNRGVRVGAGPAPRDGLMLIQGPLGFSRAQGRWLPRIENACIQSSQPPTVERLDAWIRAGVGIPTRPEWVFVKLHTHGAKAANRGVLLGEPMVRLHAALAARAAADRGFAFHYVTAREMYNLARAAEQGFGGLVAEARDLIVGPPGPDNSGSIKFPESLGLAAGASSFDR